MGMQKKIGIVTIHKVNNYGAELQAFALQQKLKDLGHLPEIIDFLYYKHPRFKRTALAKPLVALGFKKKLKEWVHPFLTRIKTLPYREALNTRQQRFEAFHQAYTSFSDAEYNSVDSLYETSWDYDLFMVGSDQVWNPYSNVSMKPYFLDFVPENARKVSYASSFGVSEIPGEAKEVYRKGLMSFDRLGVREARGVELVSEISGKKASHVVDPTLLLNQQDWVDYTNPQSIDEPYLLMYVLTDSDYTTQLAKKVANALGLKIVRLCKSAAVQDKDDAILNMTDAGPAEYIDLFQKASFVITNSFHGTAFSVNFQKPFFTVLPRHKPNNSRQKGLLEAVGLSDRLFLEGADFPQKRDLPVDFTRPIQRLDQMRQHSLAYLDSALHG